MIYRDLCENSLAINMLGKSPTDSAGAAKYDARQKITELANAKKHYGAQDIRLNDPKYDGKIQTLTNNKPQDLRNMIENRKKNQVEASAEKPDGAHQEYKPNAVPEMPMDTDSGKNTLVNPFTVAINEAASKERCSNVET